MRQKEHGENAQTQTADPLHKAGTGAYQDQYDYFFDTHSNPPKRIKSFTKCEKGGGAGTSSLQKLQFQFHSVVSADHTHIGCFFAQRVMGQRLLIGIDQTVVREVGDNPLGIGCDYTQLHQL